MKVLTMQLNSTSVMDIVAYGGAAIGMAVAVSEFLTKVSKNSPSSTGGRYLEQTGKIMVYFLSAGLCYFGIRFCVFVMKRNNKNNEI